MSSIEERLASQKNGIIIFLQTWRFIHVCHGSIMTQKLSTPAVGFLWKFIFWDSLINRIRKN